MRRFRWLSALGLLIAAITHTSLIANLECHDCNVSLLFTIVCEQLRKQSVYRNIGSNLLKLLYHSNKSFRQLTCFVASHECDLSLYFDINLANKCTDNTIYTIMYVQLS